MKTHSKNYAHTIKDHSTSIAIKKIQNYPSSTGTWSRKFQPKGTTGSKKPVYCIQPSIKEMFPLFEWEAGNIRKQRKQFTKQKVWGYIKMSLSKQVYVTNTCVEDHYVT